jgi:hypothetical protein
MLRVVLGLAVRFGHARTLARRRARARELERVPQSENVTPLKRGCRRRCRESVRSEFEFGIYCVGSSIGAMVMLLALGVMSITWMCVVAALVLAQKLLPSRAFIDAPLALTIIALGVLVVVAPSSIPGLTPTM